MYWKIVSTPIVKDEILVENNKLTITYNVESILNVKILLKADHILNGNKTANGGRWILLVSDVKRCSTLHSNNMKADWEKMAF